MLLLLTDRLACPRCGPSFGLILRADAMQDRRVHHGVLGCPNCRDAFPVADGFADLRAPPRGALPDGRVGDPPAPGEIPSEEAVRLRALLDLHRGPGTVALVGAPAAHAVPLAAAVEDIEVVAVDAGLAAWPDAPGVSRVVAAPGLPFFSGVLRGVVVDGRLGEAWVKEAARVIAPRCRVVVTGAGAEQASVLEEAGLSVLVSEAETAVATRG